MKKLIALLMALIMVLSLCACGAKKGKTDDKKDSGKPSSSDTDSGAEGGVKSDLPGEYVLQYYSSDEKSYSYDVIQNMIVLGTATQGSLVLKEDGTGHITYFDADADITWTEDAITLDGKKLDFLYENKTVYLTDAANTRVDFCKVSHLDYYNLTVETNPSKELAEDSDYVISDLTATYYVSGIHPEVFVSAQIENKSDTNLLLEDLYFSAYDKDGKQTGFFWIPNVCQPIIPPGEKGYYAFCVPYHDKESYISAVATEKSFPKDGTVKLEEINLCKWTGDFTKYDAQVTDVVKFQSDQTDPGAMIHRPNGVVTIPSGTDIQDIYVYTYCFDKNGKLVGISHQFACEESVNPVNFFEATGDGKAKFQMNLNGPINDHTFPQDSIDTYTVQASSPHDFY